jgi:hypothetical protein
MSVASIFWRARASGDVIKAVYSSVRSESLPVRFSDKYSIGYEVEKRNNQEGERGQMNQGKGGNTN